MIPGPHRDAALSEGVIIDQLIRDCLASPLRDVPVVLLLGTRGSGKTTWLDRIEEDCSGAGPWVRLDLREGQVARPHQIAELLAEGLKRPVKRLGRLRFPRLALGLAVIRGGIDTSDREQARAQLKARLHTDRDLGDFREIMDSLGGAHPAAKLPVAVAKALTLIVARIIPPVYWAAKLRRPAFRWYRQAMGEDDPLDALLTLHGWEADAAFARVDEKLCAAFVADLRDAYTRGLKANERTRNCLALIDDAVSPACQAFLETLARHRHRYDEHARRGCDPLVVVAACHTRFPGLDLRDARSPQEATHRDWARGDRSGSPQSWFCQVKLGDLDDCAPGLHDLPQLSTLAGHWPQATAVDDVVWKLRRLTRGHPLGTSLALRAVAATVERHGVERVDLRDILHWPDPDDPKRTLAEGVVTRLLPGNLPDGLATCAAARDVEIPSRWTAMDRRAMILDEFCAADLWVEVQPAEDGRPEARVLHPFPRRVLLHALAGRAERHPACWRVVHGRLRDSSMDRDVTHAMHHTLALGELAPVVAHLDQRFGAIPAQEWLKELHAITAAPRIVQPSAAIPPEVCESLASATPGGNRVTTRLVAAMWISADPLGDPDRTLDVIIAHELERLADHAGHEAYVLLTEANRYRTRGQRGD
ncbi:MAG: hypothetical protein ACRD0K_06590 [Egibacteraceae bacterium]